MTSPNTEAISWVEKDHKLVGTVDPKFNALRFLEREVTTIPLDIPNMKSKRETKSVTIIFPGRFSKTTKETLVEKIKETYPDFKVNLDKNISIETVFPSFEI